MKNKTRVLWITFGGSWIIPLLEALKNEVEIEVILLTFNEHEKTIVHDVVFHYMQITDKFCYSDMTYSSAINYLRIIEVFKPDIIHVHGTEVNYGQISRFVKGIPIVVSIQGILTECYPVSTNGLNESDMRSFRTLKNIMGRGGLYAMKKHWENGSKTFEIDIIKNTHYFFCRTNWDKAFVKKYNSHAHVFQGEELLRSAFYKKAGKWKDETCIPQRIFTTAGFNPIKGLHHAIRILSEVKKQWPKVSMIVPGTPMHVFAYRGLKQRIFGEEYVGYCNYLIEELGVKENIIFLPQLDDEEMAEQLLKANVFLSATSIDNSPNALGEAMMIGVPAVITSVGGVSSIIKNEENGLLSTIDQLAYNVCRVFQNKDLMFRLSKGAQATALRRHDRLLAKQQYIDAYQYIISDYKN